MKSLYWPISFSWFKIVPLVIGLGLGFQCQAQEVKTDTTAEQMDKESFEKLKNGYNYFIRAEEEELSLFKIDLLGPGIYLLNDWKTDSVGIAVARISFEHKLKPNISLIVGTTWKANGDEIKQIRNWFGPRLYYNMNKRIMKGKSANNFSADYIGITLVNTYEPTTEDSGITLNSAYGMQRRLGKYGYINFEIGVQNIFSPTSNENGGIGLYTELELGIAF